MRLNSIPVLIFLLSSISLPTSAFSETKVFIEEYTYQASEADSKLSSRAIAIEQAKRLLLEKLGTYLESETEVKNFQLTRDQIVVLTAGILRAEIIDERWDGKTYYQKAKIAADPQEVIKFIDLLRQDRQKTKELEETRKKADEALKEVERLREELKMAKGGKTEQGQYIVAVNKLSATDWFARGLAFVAVGKRDFAYDAFTRAIELNPKYAEAYYNRAEQHPKEAIKDYDRAIELNPEYAAAFLSRGLAYKASRNIRQAMMDFDKVTELNPTTAFCHCIHGLSYYELGDYHQAIKDFDKAIQLDRENVLSYSARGLSYYELGDYHQAIRDFDKAIQLDSRNPNAYLRRAICYKKLGELVKESQDLQTLGKLPPGGSDFLSSHGIW